MAIISDVTTPFGASYNDAYWVLTDIAYNQQLHTNEGMEKHFYHFRFLVWPSAEIAEQDKLTRMAVVHEVSLGPIQGDPSVGLHTQAYNALCDHLGVTNNEV